MQANTVRSIRTVCPACSGAQHGWAPSARTQLAAFIFHNALHIAEIVHQLQDEGEKVDPEDLAQVSPYLTEHIRRFGEYSTHELAD